MKIDPAIARALVVDPADCEFASHGGSGFSSTSKLTVRQPDGTTKQYFVKTGVGADKATMFEGEHASLNAIHDAVPMLCPASLAFGALDESRGSYFLVTDFLDFSARSKHARPGSGLSLAEKLGRLHTTPAPTPEGYSKPVYGFPVVRLSGTEPGGTTGGLK